DPGLSRAGRVLDGALGLLHGPRAGHVPGRRGLSARQGRGSRGVRQAPSSQRIPMHLSLRVPGAPTMRDANRFDVIIIDRSAGGGSSTRTLISITRTGESLAGSKVVVPVTR